MGKLIGRIQFTLGDSMWIVMTFGVACVMGVILKNGVATTLESNVLGIVVGIGGFFVITFISGMLHEWVDRQKEKRILKKISQCSNDELWKIINEGPYTCWYTLALLQLASKEENIYQELPRILDIMESNIWTFRYHAWTALSFVFTEHANFIEGYDPRASSDDCRTKVAELRENLEQITGTPKVLFERCCTKLDILKQIAGIPHAL